MVREACQLEVVAGAVHGVPHADVPSLIAARREGVAVTALLGTCPACGELVWEGDWLWVDQHIHPECWEKYLLAELSGLLMAKYPGSERLRPIVAELTRRTRDREVEDKQSWDEAERLIRRSFEKAQTLEEFIGRTKTGLLRVLRR